MSIFDQLQAAEAELERIRTVEAAKVDEIWAKAREAGRIQEKNFYEQSLLVSRLRKEWLRVNNTKRCG